MAVLRMTGETHRALGEALVRPDGKEAAAILLCRESHAGELYLARTIRPAEVLHSTECHVTWSGDALNKAQDLAEEEALSVILCHSHPSGALEFSVIDDESDRETMGSLFSGWLGDRAPRRHGSLIMTPDGSMKGRLYERTGEAEQMDRVMVSGESISLFDREFGVGARRRDFPRAFGPGMTELFGRLSVTVVGVSGTGSVVAEQLVRLGTGHVRLVDFDRVEGKNLNRIVNSTARDADRGVYKSEMMARAGRGFGSGSEIESRCTTIIDRETILATARSDLIFCCVDSLDAREVCDSLSAAFLVPLIDVGVIILTRLDGDGDRRIADVLGRIDYVRPGGPSLLDRGVYSPESLRRECLQRNAPDTYAAEVAEGYIQGVADEAPPVTAVNMKAASSAVLEMVGRLCPYRMEGNEGFSRTILRMAEGEEEHMGEGEFGLTEQPLLAQGDMEPLLGMPILAEQTGRVAQ